MAQYSYPQPMAAPVVAVISPHFCPPYAVDLTILRKLFTLSEGNFDVIDNNGNILLKVKGKVFSRRNRHVLLDGAGVPILTLQEKIFSMHGRWKVYRGESTDDKDLIFSAKKSSLIQFKTELDVFMAANTSEDFCDFKVKGSWFDRSCAIYLGDASTIVAQMHQKYSVQSVVLGKDKFAVTVHPNVDYAFIVALVVILHEINEKRDGGGEVAFAAFS